MHTVTFLANLVENHQVLVYLIIFLAIIAEGEFILLCTGVLLHLAVINVYFTLPFVLLASLSKTGLGYYIGGLVHKKWHHTKFLRYIEKRVGGVMPHFKEKPFWSIFISKFLMLNHVVIIFAGYKKIPLKKYLEAELSSTLIWAPGLLFLGYFFSVAAFHISHNISQFTLIVLALVALFLILDKVVSFLYKMFEEIYHAH